jgi:hypothetical protein
MTKNIIRKATFDGNESGNPDYNRASCGNNRWTVSNIRQWLNSSKSANSWFTPQHEYDAPPDIVNVNDNEAAAYANDPGFLRGFSADILQHFTDITNITTLPIIDGGDLETTTDKVFLASYTEMFDYDNNNVAEGIFLNIRYQDEMSTSKSGADGLYWMRSPESDIPCAGMMVNEYGRSGFFDVGHTKIGIAPLIVLH